MVLDGEGPLLCAAKALDRMVVEVQVRQFDVFAFEAFNINAEAVVLAGYLDLCGFEVLDRVIGPPMPELEFIRPGPKRKRQELMAQTDSEDRRLAQKPFYCLNRIINGGRVARPVA